eukprot:4154769-Pyramimonas_sp.AAC.1
MLEGRATGSSAQLDAVLRLMRTRKERPREDEEAPPPRLRLPLRLAAREVPGVSELKPRAPKFALRPPRSAINFALPRRTQGIGGGRRGGGAEPRSAKRE